MLYKKTIISEIREKQDNEFLKMVLPRNKKEAKFILTKYDLKHPLIEIIKADDEFSITCEKIKEAFKNREKFLKFMTEYL